MKGIVACVSALAAEEGGKVLEAGGNAFDAAVATAFVQMIVTPFSCGVGGMMSAHLWAPQKKDHLVIDGCLRAGSLVTDSMWENDYLGESTASGSSQFEDFRSTKGYTSVCTPGSVAVLAELHQRYCSWPWIDLLRPAISIARKGYVVIAQAPGGSWRDNNPYEPDRIAAIKATSECAKIYLRPDGLMYEVGEIIRNPDYADTLEKLGKHGAKDFYNGELANEITKDLEKNGAFVTRNDFSSYKISLYRPRNSRYRNYQISSNYAPGGGPLLHESLNVLSGINLGVLDHSGFNHLSYIGSTLQLVHKDRQRYLGDPEYIGYEPCEVLMSVKRSEQIRNEVLSGAIGDTLYRTEDPDTTHLTVVDNNGNIASITHSLGGFSGVVTPGLGFIYSNGMNRFDPRPGHTSSLAPQKARLHLMMPSIAFRNGVPVMVLGAPGGNAILSAVVQVFSNVADFGMTAVEAVSAPRIHAEGATIWCESRIRTGTCTELREHGYTVVHDPVPYSSKQALAQLVIIGLDGNLDGASDPRGDSGLIYSEI